jgi:hypothetical protein
MTESIQLLKRFGRSAAPRMLADPDVPLETLTSSPEATP